MHSEGILEHIAADEEIGKPTAWTAFSGLLDDAKIKGADLQRKEKMKSESSAAVYNTDQFDTFTASGTMNSPASNAPYNLTVAKAKAPELPTDYEPLGLGGRRS